MVKHALLVTLLVGCASFEDPDIILDFRVLAAQAEPPEQIIDLDITNPAPPVELLEQMVPTEVCWLLADRNFERRLRWTMKVCNLNNDERCSGAESVIGRGIWNDPELESAPADLCATVPVDGNLLGVLLYALEADQLRGLGGIYYGVQLIVGGEDADPALDLYAAKNLRVQPRIPAELTANVNPYLLGVDIRLNPEEVFQTLPLLRCQDQANPITVAPKQRVRLAPIEPEGVRETYVVPTTDGMKREFTESPTYQWHASAGNFAGGRTGGTRDAFGNPAVLFTEWIAPAADDLEGPTDVAFWFIQRDERLGVQWYESCLRVVPP